VYLENPIGSGGLTNAGESVVLYDSDAVEVDAVSWGADTTAFDPSVDIAGISDGYSISRVDKTKDDNAANDWYILENPTPGA